MKKEDCYFYYDDKCLIFKSCNDKKVKKCDWFWNKKVGCPEGFVSRLMFVNTITQARNIIFQKRYSKILICLTVILAILAGIQIYLLLS